METRRGFFKAALAGGLSGMAYGSGLQAQKVFAQASEGSGETDRLSYTITRQTPARLFDGEQCWVHPRGGIVPGAGKDGMPAAVITMTTQDLSGSDVYKSMWGMRTNDLGENWLDPEPLRTMAPRFELHDDELRPVAASDFWPMWHAASGKLLGTGHTVVYTPEWRVSVPRPRSTVYSTYHPELSEWAPWRRMHMPDDPKFDDSGAGSTQRYDLPDGTILLPIYFQYRPPKQNAKVTVVRCEFDGEILRYKEHGDELHVDDDSRGLHEPSITRFDGRYFLTIRHDMRGYVTRSNDGMSFEPMRTWKFDDGSDLGNYNTQQNWVTHSNGLFLVYNRRGADNDHVMRHRAPLFIAQVDPEKLCVIRETEKVLVPERGARLGNFGVTDVSPNETWVTVAEWMQPKGVEKYGSDGSVWVARIHWDKPNRYFNEDKRGDAKA